jgi:hypothetical protein
VGAYLGAKQPVDEAAQSVSLSQGLRRDQDSTGSDQDEIALHLLILGVRGFEMLISVTHGPATGLGKPERRVVSRPGQMITEVGQASRHL